MKHELFVKSWWVWVFCIVAFSLYEQASMKLEREITSLDSEIKSLEERICEAVHTQNLLTLQAESSQDPAWIELTLIRVLGVVPEGYTKVYYKEP
jgi:hypothetical protein